MIQTASLSQQIEQALKAEILAGSFEPGQRIGIEELSENWGVSITPVRDAVKQLEKRGLVEVVSRRGVYVSTVDWRTFRNVFQLRIALESMAVRKASQLIPDEEIARALAGYEESERRLAECDDRDFLMEHDHALHNLVVDYSDNEKLIEIMRELHDLSVLARSALITNLPDSYEQALPEHLAIMQALQARDADAAEEAMRTHLTNVLDRARDNWSREQNGN